MREGPSSLHIYRMIPHPPRNKIDRLYKQALETAYQNGVTGVHSFDSGDAFAYYASLAERGKLGLRINYYFPVESLGKLLANKIYYGMGDEFLRLAGIKIFSDGSLGSQSALCFNKYLGSKDNYGIETEVIVASVRNPLHVIDAALVGGHIATIPYKVFKQMLGHPLTDIGIQKFLDDWEKVPK